MFESIIANIPETKNPFPNHEESTVLLLLSRVILIPNAEKHLLDFKNASINFGIDVTYVFLIVFHLFDIV